MQGSNSQPTDNEASRAHLCHSSEVEKRETQFQVHVFLNWNPYSVTKQLYDFKKL